MSDGKQIARTVRLGQRPANINDVVRFVDVDGAELLLPATFRYRTLTEFGGLLDEVFGAVLETPVDEQGRMSSKIQQRQRVQLNGQYLFAILADWGLDVPLTIAACIQLADELPAAAQALMDRYRQLITEGRLGN
ncbi:hypothetical protein D8I35_09430 [Corticibacter populi]|uniref:Tail assembly chaperone n=1 Tax=Corticibacter populi TaxID=1550736 RepID=A0A3M6QW18_9BURK|nr:phage tail assembly chaperone [Corticibacter populi]RMX06712.1 hypothetical protein D8I35_09430 [Corticibacter populi]RZS31707.1 tail assembly chaperone [Corticibacter populi]